jgi:hypothetical protein
MAGGPRNLPCRGANLQRYLEPHWPPLALLQCQTRRIEECETPLHPLDFHAMKFSPSKMGLQIRLTVVKFFAICDSFSAEVKFAG